MQIEYESYAHKVAAIINASRATLHLILSWSPTKAKTKNNESCAEIDANFYLHLPKFAVGLI